MMQHVSRRLFLTPITDGNTIDQSILKSPYGDALLNQPLPWQKGMTHPYSKAASIFPTNWIKRGSSFTELPAADSSLR